MGVRNPTIERAKRGFSGEWHKLMAANILRDELALAAQ
jgi:hypothetical protein